MAETQMRQIDALLAKYTESHLNPTNEAIHCVCVPAIVFSLLGLIWAAHPWAALAVVVISLFYYASLSISFMAGMLMMSGAMLSLLALMPQAYIWQSSLAIFVLAWIGQFIGHKIEGKKPSFFDDLRFLMIGPLYVLGFLYRRMRIAY